MNGTQILNLAANIRTSQRVLEAQQYGFMNIPNTVLVRSIAWQLLEGVSGGNLPDSGWVARFRDATRSRIHDVMQKIQW